MAGVLRSVIPELDLRSWKTVDYRLKALPDHLLILALHQRGLPGLVTCDEEMLELPEVLAVVNLDPRSSNQPEALAIRAPHLKRNRRWRPPHQGMGKSSSAKPA